MPSSMFPVTDHDLKAAGFPTIGKYTLRKYIRKRYLQRYREPTGPSPPACPVCYPTAKRFNKASFSRVNAWLAAAETVPDDPAPVDSNEQTDSESESDAQWGARCEAQWHWQQQLSRSEIGMQRSTLVHLDAENKPTCEGCRLQFSSADAFRVHLQDRDHAVSILQARRCIRRTGEQLPMTVHPEPAQRATVHRQLEVANRVLVTRTTRHGRKSQPPPRGPRAPAPRDPANCSTHDSFSAVSECLASTPKMASGPSIAERVAEVRYFLEYTSGR